MKKIGILLLISVISLSLFGCIKQEPPKEEEKKEEKQETVKPSVSQNNTEEQFFHDNGNLQTIYSQLQKDLIDHYIVVNSAVIDGNTLTYSLANSYSLLQFSYQTELNNTSISFIENNNETLTVEKQACIKAIEPSLAPVSESILNIVSKEGNFEFNGNTYSQKENVFTISINASEPKTYSSSIKAALVTYRDTPGYEEDRIQLALYTYANEQHQKFNSILIEKNSSHVSDFGEEKVRFIDHMEEGRVEVSSQETKNKQGAYKDDWGSLIVKEGQENIIYSQENGLNPLDTFISRLCLNQLSNLDALKKDDSLQIIATPTNTALLITVDGILLKNDTPYKSTIILTEDEISITESTGSKIQNFTYTFSQIYSVQPLKDIIYNNTFDYQTLIDTLKDWI